MAKPPIEPRIFSFNEVARFFAALEERDSQDLRKEEVDGRLCCSFGRDSWLLVLDFSGGIVRRPLNLSLIEDGVQIDFTSGDFIFPRSRRVCEFIDVELENNPGLKRVFEVRNRGIEPIEGVDLNNLGLENCNIL